MIVGHVDAPSTVYLNRGAPRGFEPVAFGDRAGAVYGFALGDLDRDGAIDIVAARSDAPNVVYFGPIGQLARATGAPRSSASP